MSTVTRLRPPLHVVPWILALALTGAFVALGLAGWPGEFAGAGGRFCEAFRDGWIAQPANTWSNLGFVAAGLWMASRLRGGRVRVAGAGRNLFTRSRALPVLYTALVVALGPGSMAMHGSGRAWGSAADVVSMLIWVAFPVAYALVRALRAREPVFWAVYLALALGLSVPRAFGSLPFAGSTAYAVLLPAWIGLEWLAQRRHPQVSRDRRWLALAGIVFLVALAVWRLSHTGAALCDPASLVQGHAIWHLLCAASTVAIFMFYATEDDGVVESHS